MPPSYCKKTESYDFEGAYEYMTEQGVGEISICEAPQWLLDKLLELIPIEEIQKNQKTPHDEVIKIKEVMDFYKINLKETSPGVFQGTHPIHGSSNGSNFKIDTNKNIWACYRHTKDDGKPVGGGSLQLIAMMERIVTCEQCLKGALRGDKFKKVIEVLNDKFNISKEMFKKEVVNPMYEIACNVRDGDLEAPYVYCIEEDKYYVYDDNYWKAVHELELSAEMNKKIPEINKHSIGMKMQIFGHLRVLLQKRMDCFNSSSLLNFEDGEFDPITKTLYPHIKEHYSTTRLPYKYDETAECPLWIKTLNEIFENDQSKISTMQEFFGYCFVPEVSMKKALLLLGESNTGKSTILFVFKDLIGKINYSTVPLKHMGHPQYTPMMINKLVNIDTDVSKTAEDYEEHFKKITSGEEINCNQKFIETFDFVPKCRIILAANIFPKITDHSSAFYNRLIIIPMDRIFLPEEMDRELVPKLKQELPGIFNWCIEGLQRLKKRGRFEEVDFSIEAIEELEDANNPSNVFLREHVEVDMGGFIEKGELFEHFKRWAEVNKQWTLTAAMFSSVVFKQFHKTTPKKAALPNGKRVWRNLKYIDSKIPPPENKGWTE